MLQLNIIFVSLFILFSLVLSNPKNVSHAIQSLYSQTTITNTFKTCILTISAWNNFGFVTAFFKSAEFIHPEINCFVWGVADSPKSDLVIAREYLDYLPNSLREKFTVVFAKQLESSLSNDDFTMEELAMKFDLVEFSTTIKPLTIKWVYYTQYILDFIYKTLLHI